MVAKKVGTAPDDRRAARRDLGGNQPGAAGQRQTRQAGERRHGAPGQHRQRGADARAQRQTLLWDAVRVMTRLMRRAGRLPGAPVRQWRDRRRLAKKRARAIVYSRGQDKMRQLYRELIAAAEASRDELQAMATGLAEAAEIATERWRAEVAQYLPLIARVIVQTRRRVLGGEIVPASDKLVSLFEPHADIIVKGGRQVQYGHKLNLATG